MSINFAFGADASGVVSNDKSSVGSGLSSIPLFPGEEPSEKELSDWLEIVLPVADKESQPPSVRTGAVHRWTPAALASYESSTMQGSESADRAPG